MDTILKSPGQDMATLFFEAAFNNPKATRAMQAIIALSIFGNSKHYL
jgi:hypothetical protein